MFFVKIILLVYSHFKAAISLLPDEDDIFISMCRKYELNRRSVGYSRNSSSHLICWTSLGYWPWPTLSFGRKFVLIYVIFLKSL